MGPLVSTSSTKLISADNIRSARQSMSAAQFMSTRASDGIASPKFGDPNVALPAVAGERAAKSSFEECLDKYMTSPTSVPAVARRLPIQNAAMFNRWDEVRKHAASTPDHLRLKDDINMLPIHWAAVQGEWSTVDILADAYPESLGIPTGEGEYVIHVAAQFQAWDAVLKLAKRFPESLKKQDSHGNIVLHFVADATGTSEKACEVLLELVMQHDTSENWSMLEHKNGDGSLPIHAVAKHAYAERGRGDSAQHLLRHLSSRNTETLVVRNPDGDAPLHYAIKGRGASWVSAFQLATVQKAAIYMKDKDNRLPIHLAISKISEERTKGQFIDEHAWQLVEVLLNEYPEGLAERDPDGKVLAHLAPKSKKW
jgi:hypothetical protein